MALGSRTYLGAVALCAALLTIAGCAGDLAGREAESAEEAEEDPYQGERASDAIVQGGDPADVLDADASAVSTVTADQTGHFNIKEWCAERGLATSLQVEHCQLALVGERPDDTLWCFRREEIDETRVLYFQALYAARGGRLAKLVELPYAAGALAMRKEQKAPLYVKLTVTVSEDAKTFEVRDDTSPNCEEALERNRKEHPYEPEAAKPVEKLIKKVCAARGTYRATGKRLK